METEPVYLTPGEVARMLHVSPKTVSRWASHDLLPCLVTLGGHRRFRLEDVEKVAARMSGHPSSRAPSGDGAFVT